MRTAEISFHADGCGLAKPAINVKVRNLPTIVAEESILETAYNQTVEEFWYSANLIAQNHGYSGVFSEGRSDGWLVPYTQHDSHGKLVTTWTGQGPDKGYPVFPDEIGRAHV